MAAATRCILGLAARVHEAPSQGLRQACSSSKILSLLSLDKLLLILRVST